MCNGHLVDPDGRERWLILVQQLAAEVERLRAELDRARPVLDAARDWLRDVDWIDMETTPLARAVRAYQDQEPGT